ncbi:hypothetical protein [Flavitalea sp.]|nr:hypothetical protein [Flavitalea sp.]
MEYSLQRLGKKILLDAKDFHDIFDQFQDAEITKYGAFYFDDMIYVVDFVGIKARRGKKDMLLVQCHYKELVMCLRN